MTANPDRVPEGWNPARRLLTASEAAAVLGRPKATVRRWVAERRLRPVGRRGRGRAAETLYLEADVLRVDADARAGQPGAAARRRALAAALAQVPPDEPGRAA
jgi:excisionase family DNA binding protein